MTPQPPQPPQLREVLGFIELEKRSNYLSARSIIALGVHHIIKIAIGLCNDT